MLGQPTRVEALDPSDEPSRPLLFTETTLDTVPICYNYGCSSIERVAVSVHEWTKIEALFVPAPADAPEERHRIRQAIALLESFAGGKTVARRDKGGSSYALDIGWPGQQDCIDEATNTTTYLTLLENHGLLAFHRVGRPVYRNFWQMLWMDPHYSAQIVERKTGESFVVDSAWLDNGKMPYVESLADWYDKNGPWERSSFFSR